jgi:hypothetical protein
MGIADEIKKMEAAKAAEANAVDYGTKPVPFCSPAEVDWGLAGFIEETLPLIPDERWRIGWKVGDDFYPEDPANQVELLDRDGVRTRWVTIGNVLNVKRFTESDLEAASALDNFGASTNKTFLHFCEDGTVLRCGSVSGKETSHYNQRRLEPYQRGDLRTAIVETLYGWSNVEQGKRKP